MPQWSEVNINMQQKTLWTETWHLGKKERERINHELFEAESEGVSNSLKSNAENGF